MLRYFVVRRTRGPAWNTAVPMNAQVLWDEHAAFMNGLAAEGFVLLGGPLADGEVFHLIVNADNEEAVWAKFAADPWTGLGLLVIENVESWTILLDGRSA